MYARVSQTEADSEQVTGNLDVLRECLSSYEAQPGFRGAVYLVSQHGNRTLTITLWESERDARDAEPDYETALQRLESRGLRQGVIVRGGYDVLLLETR